MSDDLVARLRAGGETCGADTCKVKDARSGCLCALAANRIEQLEAALRPFVEPCIKHCYETCESEEERMEDCMCFKARAALEGKDD